MKKFITPILMLACMACQQKEEMAPVSSDSKVKLTVTAEKTAAVKTQIDENGKTWWSAGDAIGVIAENGGTLYNQEFTHSSTVAVETTAFTGETYQGTQYVYYPYTAGAALTAETITLNIASEQNPTVISYDGDSDLLVGRPFEVASAGNAEANVAFKRLGAILKLSLINIPEAYSAANVVSVSLVYEEPLAGDVKLDYKNGVIAGLGANTSKTVTASYTERTLGSRFDSYMVVLPQTLQQGKELSVVVKTDNGTFRKNVVLPQDVALLQGKGTPLKIDMSGVQLNKNLYIYFWEWQGEQNAQEMTVVEDGVYEWSGACPKGYFKFIESKSNYWTGYFRDDTAEDYWTLEPGDTYEDQGANNEGMFNLDHFFDRPDAEFRIIVNTNDLSVKVAPKHMYLDFWAWGNAMDAKEMTETGFGEFTWTGYIPIWDFKFNIARSEEDDYWTGYFRDETSEDYWSLKCVRRDGQVMFKANDHGWRDGVYTITVNTQTMKVKMHLHVWPIGAFEDWGWDRSKAREMTWVENGVLSWTGQVWTDCTFKFLVANEYCDPNDWASSGYGDTYIQWYGYIRDVNAPAEEYNTIVWDDVNDNQFKLQDMGFNDHGRYTITLNMNTKKISVEPAN